MNRVIASVLLFGAVLCAGPAVAAKKEERAVTADNKMAFEQQAEAVRRQMQTGGRYEFIKPGERETVDRRLDEMAAILEQGDAKSLPKDRVASLNVAQDEINGILTKRDGNRMICENTRTIGSNLKSQQCVSYGQRERSRLKTQEDLTTIRQQPRMVPKQK